MTGDFIILSSLLGGSIILNAKNLKVIQNLDYFTVRDVIKLKSKLILI
jgi:hypothetical protein